MAHKAYVDAGGKALDDERKCGAIMRMLPFMLTTEILLKYDTFANNPLLLRQWVIHHSKLLTSWQEVRGAKPAHVLEDREAGGEEDPGEGEELVRENEVAGMSPAEICALINKRWQGGKGTGKTRKSAGKGKRPEAPARDARDVRCGNCGRTGHSSAECREPKRGPGERACFNCGELGHTAFRCP